MEKLGWKVQDLDDITDSNLELDEKMLSRNWRNEYNVDDLYKISEANREISLRKKEICSKNNFALFLGD